MPTGTTEIETLSAWPAATPAGVLWTAPPGQSGAPRLVRTGPCWTWRPTRGWTGGRRDATPEPRDGEDPVGAIDRLWSQTRSADADSGWLVCLSYDLGRRLEPTAQHRGSRLDEREHPDVILVRVPAQGSPPATTVTGAARPYSLGEPDLETGRAPFCTSVRTALDRIRAGDVYQVNLTHRLSAPFTGSARALAADLFSSAQPWHGAYLEIDDGPVRRALVCASPELFLDADMNSGRVLTRPMKGTRPGEADPDELRDAPKDKAELDMITDLMRNDLGRVCAFGSVRVEKPRAIERHESGVLQATSSVGGLLREGVGFADLIRATFPPGSVTGAPKIRAMKLIDELEQHPRGPYCGACGFLSDSGRLTLGVSIRTASITGRPGAGGLDEFVEGVLDYSVGAGIVSESDPDAEWEETLVKARALTAVLRSPEPI